jgi:hypothetical protein
MVALAQQPPALQAAQSMAVAVAVEYMGVVVLTMYWRPAHLFLAGLAVLRLSQQTQPRVLVQRAEEGLLLTVLEIQGLAQEAN